jgi:ABC-type transport system involved in multi-copper enzyme maturation permease subunit
MIARIWTAYRFELDKAARRRFTYLGVVLIVIAVASALLIRPVSRDSEADYAFIAYATPIALNLLGLLVLVTYCAGLVSTELGSGSICLALVRPLRRHEFLIAKLLLGMTYAAMLTAAVATIAWVIPLAFGDLTGVTYGGETVFTATDMTAAYLFGALLALAPQGAVAAYAIMISTLTRSTGAAIGSAVGILLMLDIVKYPLRIAPFVFSTYIETPWRVFTSYCDGLDANWFPDTAYVLVNSVVYTVVFTAIAILSLSRRDLHT